MNPLSWIWRHREPAPRIVPRPPGPYSPTILTEAEWAQYLKDGRPAWDYEP